MSKKRGPYKKYLQNPDIAMPKTSRWRKQKQSLAREDAVDFPEGIYMWNIHVCVCTACIE